MQASTLFPQQIRLASAPDRQNQDFALILPYKGRYLSLGRKLSPKTTRFPAKPRSFLQSTSFRFHLTFMQILLLHL